MNLEKITSNQEKREINSPEDIKINVPDNFDEVVNNLNNNLLNKHEQGENDFVREMFREDVLREIQHWGDGEDLDTIPKEYYPGWKPKDFRKLLKKLREHKERDNKIADSKNEKGKVILPTPEEITAQDEDGLDKRSAEEVVPKLILPTAEEIMAQVEGGLDERAAEEGAAEKEFLQATLDQVVIENKIVRKGVFDRFSAEVKKAFLIFFASCTLFGAAGSFSKAEAGEHSFISQVGDTIKGGIVDQIRGGFRRGEQGADWRQQMGQQIEMQEYYNRRNDEQMEKQRLYQEAQQAANERMQKDRQREMAFQEEARRFAGDIAKANTSEEMAKAKVRHLMIIEALKNSSQ